MIRTIEQAIKASKTGDGIRITGDVWEDGVRYIAYDNLTTHSTDHFEAPACEECGTVEYMDRPLDWVCSDCAGIDIDEQYDVIK